MDDLDLDLGVAGGGLGLQGQAESDDEAAVDVDELDMDMAVAGALVDPPGSPIWKRRSPALMIHARDTRALQTCLRQRAIQTFQVLELRRRHEPTEM